ncbi:MAG: amino acid permease [Bifidobacterium longum]|nr:amino acid permease [Bifidobacterium longum]
MTSTERTHGKERSMSQPDTDMAKQSPSRHLQMISLGGVIGTGLFLSSGYTIQQAGPIGTILAYGIGALIVYLVMLTLGELSVAMPVTGSFHVYAEKFIGPGTGFVIAIQYWLTWTVALGSEFTAAGLLMQRWFPNSPTWAWSAAIKVFAICAFIVIGSLAIFGVIPVAGYQHAPMFGNLIKDGVFPNGFMPVFATILTVNFAFSGTELIGVTAGETSPFVLVFNGIGIPYAGDIMNFVVLTAVLSASNSGLYASTRMVWSMGNEGMIPRWFAKTNRRGVPMLALCAAMAGGLLALLSSVVAASTVYLVLVALSGLSAVVVWIAIAYCQIVFRRRWLAAGHGVDELKYRTPGYPYVSWAAFILCTASFVLVVFDAEQRFALVAELVFIVACYGIYFLQQWWRKRGKASDSEDDLSMPWSNQH